MIRGDRVTSIVLSLAMLLLVTVVIGLVTLVAIFCVESPLWRVVWMVVLSVGLLFLTSASKLRPVGAILAMVVGFALDELGTVPVGELATRALLYAWLMVAIPVGVGMVVNLLVAPSPRRLACQALARKLRIAARNLTEADVGPADRDRLDECLREDNQQIETWLRLSKVEGTTSATELAALQQAVLSTTAILMAANLSATEPRARLPHPIATRISETLQNMADILEQGGYPVDIELPQLVDDDLPPLKLAVLSELHSAVTRFAEADIESTLQEKVTPTKVTSSFLLPDAFSNPNHLRYALKTTAAAILCYVLYSQLDWPGIHTCFITCYLVALGNVAETVEKLTLRIIGCLIGALIGMATIVWLLPAMTSVTELIVLVFVSMWLAAWVAQGSPRISYAGFQIAFAFLLCVLQGPAPAFDLTIARDRIIGILLGNVIVYLMFTRVSPVSIAGQVDAALGALLRQWEAVMQALSTGERRKLLLQALAQHSELRSQVELARYEPARVRPRPEWTAQRFRTLAELSALEGPLFLMAERAPAGTAIEARLRSVAIRAGVTDVQSISSREVTPDTTHAALLELADERLGQIAQDVGTAVLKEWPPYAPA
jgi:multidrug resistance protein MdtO